MIKFHLAKFADDKWLILRIREAHGRFDVACYDSFKTQKESNRKLGLYKFIAKCSAHELEKIRKEVKGTCSS